MTPASASALSAASVCCWLTADRRPGGRRREHRQGGQQRDELARGRSGPRATRALAPRRPAAPPPGPRARSTRPPRGRRRSANEPIQSATVPLSERNQPFDVGGGAGRQDDADRRNEASGDAAPPQHDVDEGAADAAVAVDERVDGLELRVGHGRLRHRRQVVPRHEGDEVLEQRQDEVLRRRHEGRVGRVPEPARRSSSAPRAPGRVAPARRPPLAPRGSPADRPRTPATAVPDRDRLLHRGHVRRDDPGAASRRPGVDERTGEVERGDVVALDPR